MNYYYCNFVILFCFRMCMHILFAVPLDLKLKIHFVLNFKYMKLGLYCKLIKVN